MTRIVTGGVSSNTIATWTAGRAHQAVFASSIDLGPVAVKIPVLYWILLTALLSWLLLRTRVGNWIFAVGGDSAAARAVGVPVVATGVGLFMGVGFGAWLLGMHMLFEYNNVQSGQGVGNEFIYIIAAVIGGCLLTGGYGSILGAAIGALICGMTQLGISYAGWDVDWQDLPRHHAHRRDPREHVRQEGERAMNTAAVKDSTTSTTELVPSSRWSTWARATATSTPFAESRSACARARSPACSATTAPGKSTLIKIMAGLHDYTEGQMKVNGIQRNFRSPRVAQCPAWPRCTGTARSPSCRCGATSSSAARCTRDPSGTSTST